MAKGPKMKTHKASSKVFNKKKNGTLTYKVGNGNHKTSKDSAKQVRQRRNKGVLSKGEASRIKSVI
ncbi:MAG: 50S ribosomal protein L35 [Bacilli bacterium]|nr:50S ribosomal protein L35 [Bacilli bacterium]MBR1748610.1 50S ribosomal protein L35 [Bacilli bacterium]MBR1817714.1 50S ribosomal protein L35 [Bacilli bacterium]